MAAASQEARAGAERRRWFAAASAAVERRQASASRWTRAAPPPLPFPASGGRMKVAGAEVGHTRLSAFRLPDFMRQARSRWMPVPRRRHPTGSGRSFSFSVGAKLGCERAARTLRHCERQRAIQRCARGWIASSRSLASGRPLRAGPVGALAMADADAQREGVASPARGGVQPGGRAIAHRWRAIPGGWTI